MFIEKHSVDGLTIECDNLMISLKKVPFNHFIMNKLLQDLADAQINVDIISRTAPIMNAFDISVIVRETGWEEVEKIVNALGDEYPEIKISMNKDITRLHLNGLGMRTQSGVAARFLKVFADNDVRVLMITTSEIGMACVVKNDGVKQVVEAISKEFSL